MPNTSVMLYTFCIFLFVYLISPRKGRYVLLGTRFLLILTVLSGFFGSWLIGSDSVPSMRTLIKRPDLRPDPMYEHINAENSLFERNFYWIKPTFTTSGGLEYCKDSSSFEGRRVGSIEGLNEVLVGYETGTPSYLLIQESIERTKARFDGYRKQNLLCGADGLPRLIVDGSPNHAGEFVLPGLVFLYIAGYIGWVARQYLMFTNTLWEEDEIEKKFEPVYSEVIIDVRVALPIMLGAFWWPLDAWNALLLEEDSSEHHTGNHITYEDDFIPFPLRVPEKNWKPIITRSSSKSSLISTELIYGDPLEETSKI